MKSHLISRLFVSLAIVAISLSSFVSTAYAMPPLANVGTTLTIQPPDPVSVGNKATVLVQMMSSKGLPVANQPVEMFVNGVSLRRARTDSAGNVAFTIHRDEAGKYALNAVFKGSKLPSLGSSKATAELIVTPALIEVRTTPSLSGVKFTLDGKVFSSDDYGVARIEVNKVGKYHLEVLPLDAKNKDIQMAFGRWGDDYFQPTRDIEVPLDRSLEVGFEVSYKVSQTFIDLSHRPVNEKRVTSVTLKGSNGTTFTFEDNLPHWLPAGRVIRLNNGLEQTKILYSVISVVIDGSNVVSQAQQRFFVNPNDVWTVQLLLYKASFMARDALFRFPVGSGIHMEYPDGDLQSFTFGENQKQTIDGLARGIYRVTVTGAEGIAPATPIALSRNQDVELLVFSYLDIGVFVLIGLFLSLGLLLFGRPYIVKDTGALAYRITQRLVPGRQRNQPGVQPQLFTRLKARLARPQPEAETVRLEENASVVSDPPVIGEEQIPEVPQHSAAVDEGVIPGEAANGDLEIPAKDVSNSEPKQSRRRGRKSAVENPA